MNKILTGAVATLAGAAVALTTVTTASAAPRTDWGTSPNASTVVASIVRSNEKAAFDYFVNHGMTKVRAAGIIGNLDQESGVDPTIHQIGGGPGRGIAQWSVGGRWDTYANDNVVAFAKKEGKSATSLSAQLDFVWYELHTYSYYGFAQLHAATTINAAVIAFQDHYEGCGQCNTTARENYAHDAYNRYA